jgi:surface protein
MNNMFDGATSFNQPLADWNVSSVISMREMFDEATSFNQPLADWNVSSVETMQSMFEGATSFDQPLGNWNVSSGTNYVAFMFYFSGCPLADGQQSCFYV